jgi:hypothetical protein
MHLSNERVTRPHPHGRSVRCAETGLRVESLHHEERPCERKQGRRLVADVVDTKGRLTPGEEKWLLESRSRIVTSTPI